MRESDARYVIRAMIDIIGIVEDLDITWEIYEQTENIMGKGIDLGNYSTWEK